MERCSCCCDRCAQMPPRRGRTPEQQARAERRVKIEAAKLREALDRKLGRETPDWVVQLAREKA